jgi:ferritin-like metal-binding protein YciE
LKKIQPREKLQKPEQSSGDRPGLSRQGGSERPGGSSLERLFMAQLKDIYYVEKRLMELLPRIKQGCTTEELEDAFELHTVQTEKQAKRLEKIFAMLKQEPEAKRCEALEGLSKEAEETLNETEAGSMTRDAALIITAQKVEHYEIASYGGLMALAFTMELPHIARLLEKTLFEEEETDHLLTEIAEGFINLKLKKKGLTAGNLTAHNKTPNRLVCFYIP